MDDLTNKLMEARPQIVQCTERWTQNRKRVDVMIWFDWAPAPVPFYSFGQTHIGHGHLEDLLYQIDGWLSAVTGPQHG